MATAVTTPFITVEHYLKTLYRPDVDYVDGHIEERNLGEFDHGTTIGALIEFFRARRQEWNIRVALDTRMQITPTRYRVPDISITSLATPKEQILRTPPILCIEVLSPEDTFAKMRRRIGDYFLIGVAHVWIFDLPRRTVTACQPKAEDVILSSGLVTVPGTPIAVPVEAIFSSLDEE